MPGYCILSNVSFGHDYLQCCHSHISTLDILLSQLQTLDFFQLFSLSNSGFVFIVE